MYAARSPMPQRLSVSARRARAGHGSAEAVGLDPASVLFLQRSAGNAAVSALLQRRPGRLLQRGPLRVEPRMIRTEKEIEAQAMPLAEKMGGALHDWKAQAYWGVQNFVNEELEKRIDALRSAGLTTGSFLQSLAGNLIWAAACFIPGAPALAFAVSVYGIGITASASPPSATDPADKGSVSKVAEQVQGYLDKVEEEIRGKDDANLLEMAKKLVLFNEDLSQPELLELFMKQTFPRELLQGGAGGKLIRFNDEAVKKAQKAGLKERFRAFMDVVPLVGTKTEPDTVLGRKLNNGHTLSLVAVSGVGGTGPGSVRYGIGYELKKRQTSLDGRVVAPGEVVIAKWVADEVVSDVLQRADQLKTQLIINALASEVKMGPDAFAADEARKRELTRQGGMRPG
jgi:acetyl esterase/lipase